MSKENLDLVGIGNAIVDVLSKTGDDFLRANRINKGTMTLIEADQAEALYAKMGPGLEVSGGSAANTVAAFANMTGKAGYIGKVANDQLGTVFRHDIQAIGVSFDTPALQDGPPTARCLILITPDAQRTMCTFLGAANQLTPADVSPAIVEQAHILYLEGYLFDPPEARRAFAKAAGLARSAGRLISITLSDGFVVGRHRQALLEFIETQVDLLFANESEITALFQVSEFDEAVIALKGLVPMAAVTRSEQGSVALAGDEIHVIPAAPVEKVVDTTGAGDQYAAGFLFGLARGRSLDVCGRLGSLAAAEVISHYGPRPQASLRDLAAAAGLQGA